MGITQTLYEKLSDYLSRDALEDKSFLCDFDHISHEIRPADVILVEGRTRVSKIIRRITLNSWTHAALYIGRLHDVEDPHIRARIQKYYKGDPHDQLIIESLLGRGTVISNLADYKNDHLRLCRPSGLAYQDAQHVIAHATESIGRQYNVRQFIDLGRFYLRHRLIPSTFKSSLLDYKPGTATEEICSTMIAEAFMSVKFPILPLVRKDDKKVYELIPRNPKLFIPADFDYSPYFDIIKYPIFHIARPAHYRDLPWNEGYFSNDDYGVGAVKDDNNK